MFEVSRAVDRYFPNASSQHCAGGDNARLLSTIAFAVALTTGLLSSPFQTHAQTDPSVSDQFWAEGFERAGIFGRGDDVVVGPDNTVYALIWSSGQWDGWPWRGVAAFDEKEWYPVIQLEGVQTLAISPAGELYIGGQFGSIEGQRVNNVADPDFVRVGRADLKVDILVAVFVDIAEGDPVPLMDSATRCFSIPATGITT